MIDLNIYGYFFSGFGYSSVLPFTVGVYLGIKRALWAGAFDEC